MRPQIAKALRDATSRLELAQLDRVAQLDIAAVFDFEATLLAERLRGWVESFRSQNDVYTASDIRRLLILLNLLDLRGRKIYPNQFRVVRTLLVGYTAQNIPGRVVDALHRQLGNPARLPIARAVLRGGEIHARRYGIVAHQLARNMAQDLRKQLGRGLKLAESVGGLLRRLARLPLKLRKNRIPVNVQAAAKGVATRHQAWASSVASNAVYTTYNDLTDRGARTLVGLGAYKIWDATIDSRTCKFCASLHGTAVGVNEEFPLVRHPPVHRRCRCGIILYIP